MNKEDNKAERKEPLSTKEWIKLLNEAFDECSQPGHEKSLEVLSNFVAWGANQWDEEMELRKRLTDLSNK